MRLVFIFCLLVSVVKAEELDKAIYKVNQEGNKITVEASFPWTLRNELLDFDENLLFAQSEESFVNVLNDYIAKKLKFYSCEDSSELLNVIDRNEFDINTAEFQFDFELNGQIESFRNEIMLNVYPKHTNMHYFTGSNFVSKDSLLITSRQVTKLYLNSKKEASNYFVLIAGGVFSLVLLLFVFLLRRNKN